MIEIRILCHSCGGSGRNELQLWCWRRRRLVTIELDTCAACGGNGRAEVVRFDEMTPEAQRRLELALQEGG